jgi:hypothetical protein
MNQINVIKPYKIARGLWVFDDPEKGLDQEPFVGGMDDLIEYAVQEARIENPEKGFLALFSKDPFPGSHIRLDWVEKQLSGNVYRWAEKDMEGWLCPALLKYFVSAPDTIYIAVKSV